jgi:hypothetical protein
MTERCACLVPGCRRTTKRLFPAHEWICGKHWPLVSRWTKRRRSRAVRLFLLAEARFMKLHAEQGGVTDTQIERLEAIRRLRDRAWERCKAEAIEKAMGIG